MSVLPTELPGHQHPSTVSIFGHKVSTDALLIAAASLIGIILLYKIGRPSTSSAVPAVGVPVVGSGTDFASTPPLDPGLIASAMPIPSPSVPPLTTVGMMDPAAVWAALGNASPTPSGSVADIEIGNLEYNALHPGSAYTPAQSLSLWQALGNTGAVPFGADLPTVERGNLSYQAQQGLLSTQQQQFIQANHLL